MTTEAFLDLLRDKGVDLWSEGGKLRVSAPRGVLTEDLRSQLAARKEALIAALGNGQDRAEGALTVPDEIDQGPGSASHAELYRRRFRADDGRTELLLAAHPYICYVNPCQGYMFEMINMGKRYIRGKGCALYDHEGNKYLDFIAAYGALPFGHNPAAIWDAMEQVRRDEAPSFIQPSILEGAGALAERIVAIAPEGMRYVTFANSGAEAVEAAMKLCRSATHRPGILSTLNSFHGKTLGALSATGKRIYQAAFNAPAQDFHFIPFGDAPALDKAFKAKPDYYAGFIVEPIQGEGGIVEPPRGYLTEVAAICQRHGTLLVVDEVQTGLGRTGAMFACNHEGVTPDVMTLAKALGGGVIPIGAAVCKEDVYNEEFGTHHTSTFGGNTLACRAGLAALEVLQQDDQALVRHAAEVGAYLKAGLARLVDRHPTVAKSVRGQGLLLGLQFNLESELFSRGFLRYLADQAIFTYTLAAHVLNEHHIRVAPTLSAPDVLRIEPPLIVEEAECDALLEALDTAMGQLKRGNVGHLIAHLIDADISGRPVPPPATAPDAPKVGPEPEVEEGRFGFITHLGDEDSWTQLDPCLEVFTEEEMARLKTRVLDLLDPVPIGEVLIESRAGQRARGEFVMLPFSAREVTEMPLERAVAEVRYAVQLCAQRGAKIVGLGGFNSIVTQGGLALAEEDDCIPLTTGNSYTAVAGMEALRMACEQRERALAACAATVVGATGALGKALALMLAGETADLHLVGNPSHPERSLSRLRDVAAAALRHVWLQHRDGKRFSPGSLAHRLASMASSLPNDLEAKDFRLLVDEFTNAHKCISLTTDAHAAILRGDLIATATSSVDKLADETSFRSDAIVCELSRPFNIGDDVKEARSDVLFIEGGLVRVPGNPDLGIRNGLPRGVMFACVAETVLLALENDYQHTSLGTELEEPIWTRLSNLAGAHGFEVMI